MLSFFDFFENSSGREDKAIRTWDKNKENIVNLPPKSRDNAANNLISPPPMKISFFIINISKLMM